MSTSPRIWHPTVVLALGLVVAVLGAGPALAVQDPNGPPPDDAPPISLRLSPAVLEVPLERGRAEHELRLDNRGSQAVDVVVELSEFTVTADGTTRFVGPPELSAVDWIEVAVDRFALEPGGRRDVDVSVEVPDDAEPGERYVSVIFAVPGDPDAEGNITVTHRVAAKLYIEVPGPRIEHVEVGELTGPRLLDTGPGVFELTVHNRGNVHRRFQEDTQLHARSDDQQFPFESFTVLGDSTRVVEAGWNDPPLLCWCTVEVRLDDGRGTILTASTRVIAFPLRLSLAMLALVAGLAIVAIGRHRRRTARFEQQLARARDEGAAARARDEGAAARAPQPAGIFVADPAVPAHQGSSPHPPTARPQRSTPDAGAPRPAASPPVSNTRTSSPPPPPDGFDAFTARPGGPRPRRRRRP